MAKKSDTHGVVSSSTVAAEVVTPKRQRKPDTMPFKVFQAHFVNTLYFVAVLNGKDVVALFMADVKSGNYSDMSQVDALLKAAKAIFRGKAGKEHMIAALNDPQWAVSYADGCADRLSATSTGFVGTVDEAITENAQ